MRHFPVIVILACFAVPILCWAVWLLLGDLPPSELPGLTLRSALLRTHWLALFVAGSSVTLAVPPALFWRLFPGRIATIMAYSITAPLLTGMLARNYAWIGMLSDRSFGTSLGWSAIGGPSILHTQAAVFLVMTFVFLPWSLFLLRLGLDGVTQPQIEAAKTLGATPRHLVIRLYGPALFRASVLAALLVYCSTLGYFITPRMLGRNSGDLAGSLIIRFIERGEFLEASLVAAALLGTTVPFAFLFLWRIQRTRSYPL